MVELAMLVEAFGAERGHALASRFEFHHTPKHASWLNVAEIWVDADATRW